MLGHSERRVGFFWKAMSFGKLGRSEMNLMLYTGVGNVLLFFFVYMLVHDLHLKLRLAIYLEPSPLDVTLYFIWYCALCAHCLLYSTWEFYLLSGYVERV